MDGAQAPSLPPADQGLDQVCNSCVHVLDTPELIEAGRHVHRELFSPEIAEHHVLDSGAIIAEDANHGVRSQDRQVLRSHPATAIHVESVHVAVPRVREDLDVAELGVRAVHEMRSPTERVAQCHVTDVDVTAVDGQQQPARPALIAARLLR